MNQTQYQKIFDNTFKNRGGLLQTELLGRDLNSILSHYKRRADAYIESFRNHESLKKDIPNIYFDYIDNAYFNAVASISSEGIYLIGLNVGSVIIIYDLFFRMLANPNILQHIGMSSLEKNVQPTIRNYYTDANLMLIYGDFDYNKYQMAIPLDKVRQIYARHLVDIAIDFLVAHELTHIINGHIDYLNEKSDISEYEERIFVYNENDVLTRQTLEMDADSLAVSKGLANAIRRHLGEQKVSEDRKPFYSSFNDTVFNWGLAVLSMIRVWVECNVYKTVNSKILTHPHPRLRQVMILATVHEYLLNYYPVQYKDFEKEIFGEIIKTVELTYNSVTGKNIDKDEFLRAIKSGEEYVPKVLQHWENIRKDLLKNSYVELV